MSTRMVQINPQVSALQAHISEHVSMLKAQGEVGANDSR